MFRNGKVCVKVSAVSRLKCVEVRKTWKAHSFFSKRDRNSDCIFRFHVKNCILGDVLNEFMLKMTLAVHRTYITCHLMHCLRLCRLEEMLLQ